jgi:hypothetical protein
MTNKSSKLNKDDIKYMLDIVQDEEERQYADIEIRDNVEVTKVNLERLQHIRTVLVGISEGAGRRLRNDFFYWKRKTPKEEFQKKIEFEKSSHPFLFRLRFINKYLAFLSDGQFPFLINANILKEISKSSDIFLSGLFSIYSKQE